MLLLKATCQGTFKRSNFSSDHYSGVCDYMYTTLAILVHESPVNAAKRPLHSCQWISSAMWSRWLDPWGLDL